MAAVEASSVLSRLKATKRLPSPPGAALRVLELCRAEDVDISEIAEVIMADPALSGRLLKFANSPIAGVGRKVSSIRDAIFLLGLRTVKMTALGFSLASPSLKSSCPGFDLKRFWSESFASAVTARRLAEDFFNADREEAFTACLLGSLGSLALANAMPVEYAGVLRATDEGTPLLEAERNAFGEDHFTFASQLLAEWELPEVLVRAVASQLAPDQAPLPSRPIARALFAARRLAPTFVKGGVGQTEREDARTIIEQVLKLDEGGWRQISEQIFSDFIQIATLFEVQIDDQVAMYDLYAEAQEEAIRVGLVTQLEHVQTVQENRDLLRRATTDPLTGIANRAKFDERIEESVNGARRGHGPFALIMIDIDHFKQFNDTYGHQVGDLVLKRVASALVNTLREVDLVARYGGEEFAILAPHTERKGACIVAARLRKRVEDLQIDVDDQTLSVTISLGLAYSGDYPSVPDATKIIADADTQLYLSKEAGRNTWSYLGRSACDVMAKR